MNKRTEGRQSLVCIICCLALLPAGCKKLQEADAPQSQLTVARVFANDSGAVAAMTGYYIQAMSGYTSLFNGVISLDAALSADELYCTAPYPRQDSFRENTLISGNGLNGDLFAQAYSQVYSLNSLLGGMAASSTLSVPVRSGLRGEADFNRALLYFYLVNLYGAVPLVTGTDYRVNEALGRASTDSVYRQIESDLQDAIGLLPDSYLTRAGYAGNRTRPNRAAALALLARERLFRGQWAGADSAATAVINNPLYALESDLNRVFLADSREAIWQLQPVAADSVTGDGATYLQLRFSGVPVYILDSSLTGAFETGDQRRVQWTSMAGERTLVYPYKYKRSLSTGTQAEYQMVFRLAEQYLIRAEARMQEGDLNAAIADLNLVRARAGLPGIAAMDATALSRAIRRERRVELFTEWGHRWLDLKRWAVADEVLAADKPWWRTYDQLYPIPAAAFTGNPRMTQNPGY